MQQTQIYFKGNDCYWRSHKLGTLFPSESVFKTINRTRKNVFHLYGGGFGCNEELLVLLKNLGIEFIEISYCNEPLRTTVDKWLRQGVCSPYSSDKIDQQIILGLNRINLDVNDPKNQIAKSDKQLSLQLGEV